MSDKELIAFLRDLPFLRAAAAADRIDELEVSLQAVLDREAATTARYDAKTDELEAKLAECEARLSKAVEALRYYAVEAMPWEADDSLIARSTLAEIESNSNKKTG
jgi:hypothetical protein